MKKHLLIVPILASLLLGGCGEQPAPDPIVATDLVLSASSISINVGETKQITAEVKPDNATDKTVVWSIAEGNEYATVDSTGLVSGVKAGSAILTATSNNITKICSISVTNPVHDILPESINIDSSAEIVKGSSKQLIATILPENATDKSVTWSVIAGANKVSVDQNGLVSANEVGSAVVEAKTINGLASTCNISVTTDVVLPTEITLNLTSFSMKDNETKQLTATVLPTDATDKSVTWSVTSGSDVVSVDANGLVSAIKAGSAVVEAKTSNGLIASCNVTITPSIILPTNISLNETSTGIIVGSSKQLTATVLPADATDKSVTWSVTSGSGVVSVDSNGLVTALKVGSAVVEAKTSNEIKATCNISVVAKEILPTEVTLNATSVSMKDNETKQLIATVLPENATDKSVTWSVISGEDNVSVDSNGVVTAIKVGESVVQVKTSNNKIAKCNITVFSSAILPTSISLNETSFGLITGTQKQLIATVLPENATDISVSYKVTNGDAVTVSSTGLVSAIKVGNAVVTASTINGLTAECSISVTAAVVDPTSVTLDKHSVNLEFGASATLSATVAPDNATDKSVTWSVIQGDAVTVTNGLVTGVKQGSAKVQVSTVNGKTDVCEFTVGARHIKGYVNKDIHSLIVGNPYEKIGEGDFVEVTDKTTEGGVPCYNFTYGATVKFNVHTDGYYEPTAIKVNDDSYSVVDNAVTFVAEVEDPDDPIFNILDIEVVFRDNTPLIGDYVIETTESTHISLVYTYDVNGQETKACSQGDKIIVTPVATDPDYEVKTIKGYTYTTNDSIQHKSYFDINEVGDGTFYFITPFSHEEIKTIWIEVTEVNGSLFKDSDLVGTYAVVRTYGLSESSTYIDKFEDQATITFASSGEVNYKDEVAYASKAENGVINATFSTSNIEMYYGKNLIVLGQSGSGQNMITPLTQDSSDLAIAVKVADGMLIKDIVIDSFAFKLGDDLYAIFTFYYNNELYASLLVNTKTKSVITDISVKQYLGDKLASDKTVFEVFDKENIPFMHVGYKNDGGKGNYVFINEHKNGWHNDNHSLVFINDNTAIYDDYICKVTGDETNIVLDAPIRHVEITLNDSEMTFVVTDEHEVIPKTLDIANKVFVGNDKDNATISMTFGPSNSEITGRLISGSYICYFWDFTGVFDQTSEILIITITFVGYYYSHTPETITKYDDYSLGKDRRLQIEDGKLTFIDNISGIENSFPTKDCSITCDDFHF